MALIGYARVSTEDQTLMPQQAALRAAGCAVIFEEHASGGSRTRPQLALALMRVRRGDTLVVTRIDRLARSLSHLLEIVERIRAGGAHFRSLSDPIDTSGPSGVLVLQMLGAVAEFERALIRERTRSGLAAARARGRIGGNPGLRSRDPIVLGQLAASRRTKRLRDLLPDADHWLGIVRQMRPARPWAEVAAAINDALPTGQRQFTLARLNRCVKLFVAEGLADATLLTAAPRRRDWRGDHARLRATEAVAALLAGNRDMTLAEIATELKRLRHRPPRGGTHWAVSSVKALLERACGAGLVAPSSGGEREIAALHAQALAAVRDEGGVFGGE
jgi:DNA invertase Pin-like site-specific DNA recombinase